MQAGLQGFLKILLYSAPECVKSLIPRCHYGRGAGSVVPGVVVVVTVQS